MSLCFPVEPEGSGESAESEPKPEVEPNAELEPVAEGEVEPEGEPEGEPEHSTSTPELSSALRIYSLA